MIKTIYTINTAVIAKVYQRQAPSFLTGGGAVLLILSLLILMLLMAMAPSLAGIAFLVMGILLVRRWKRHRDCIQALEKIKQWHVPRYYRDQLLVLFPNSTFEQRQWIMEGFKDYLALHVLQKSHLAMPSVAVDQLWHVMLAQPKEYENICQHILGRTLSHYAYTEAQHFSEQDRRNAMMQTWRLSCDLHQLHPENTAILSRLFAVDEVMGLTNHAESYLLALKHQYRLYLRSGSGSSFSTNDVSSSDGDSSCGGGCGGD